MTKKELELLRQKIADVFSRNPEEASRKAALILENWINGGVRTQTAPTKKRQHSPAPQKSRKKAA